MISVVELIRNEMEVCDHEASSNTSRGQGI